MPNRQFKYLIAFGIFFSGALILIVLAGNFYLPEKYQIGTEVVVPKTAERAWEWFVHPENWNKRFSIVQSVKPFPTQKRGVGEELKIETNLFEGEKLTSIIIVTDWLKGRIIGDRHLGDWLNERPLPLTNVLDRFEFEPEGANKTRIIFTETFNVEGPINKWLAYLFVKPAENRLMAELLNEYNHSLQKTNSNRSIHG